MAILCACTAASPAVAGDIIVHAGSWETHATLLPQPGQPQPPRDLPVHLVCRPTDRTLAEAALTAIKSHPGTTCETPSFTQSGTGATYAIACTLNDIHIHMAGTITMQGVDEFANEMKSHAEKTGGQTRDIDVKSVSKRVGPCQPGEAQSNE